MLILIVTDTQHNVMELTLRHACLCFSVVTYLYLLWGPCNPVFSVDWGSFLIPEAVEEITWPLIWISSQGLECVELDVVYLIVV